MGAYAFSDEANGTTVREAYRAAVEQAQYDHGHDTYNGTISTTNGYKVTGLDGLSIDAWLERAWERTNKWDECEALDLGKNRWLFAGWGAC